MTFLWGMNHENEELGLHESHAKLHLKIWKLNAQKTTWYSRKKRHLNPQPLKSVKHRKEEGRWGGRWRGKDERYTRLQQEEVGLEGGERRRKNEREDSWVIAAVHPFRVAVNGRQPLLC